jgi:hypothetical protein
MASFTPSNPPTRLTMVDMNSALNSLGGPAKQCRFAVRITPVGTDNLLTRANYGPLLRDLTFLCESTELPGRGFDISEVRYYGPSQNFPRNTKYAQSHDLRFICRQQSFERQLFDDWLEIINPTNIFDFNYASQYYCQIDVYQLAEFARPGAARAATEPQAMYQWSLHRAWPMVVNPQPVTWADQDILRLEVSFAYKYWTRPGRDIAPQT